jgi:hypothetical protein
MMRDLPADARLMAMAMALLLGGCRAGHVAGSGAACERDDDCRIGYRCDEGVCRVEAHDAGARGDHPRDAAAPGADGAAGAPADAAADLVAEAPGLGDAAALEAAPPASDGPVADLAPAPTPSLSRCTEYLRPDAAPASCPTGPNPGAPDVAAFSPDGKWLVTTSYQGPVRLWNVRAAELSRSALVLQGAPLDLVFSPDASLVALDGEPLGLWRLADGVVQASIPLGQRPSPGSPSRLAGFSRDGQRVAVLTASTARVWSLARQALERDVPLPPPSFTPLKRVPSIDRDGHWWLIVAGPNEADLQILDLNAPEPKPALLVRAHTGGSLIHVRIAVTDDGDTLALADRDGLWLWDIQDKASPRRLPGPLRPPEVAHGDIADMTFSSSGRYLVVGLSEANRTKGEVVIYDVPSRQALAGRTTLSTAHRVAFSPDERAVAVVVANCDSLLYCRD